MLSSHTGWLQAKLLWRSSKFLLFLFWIFTVLVAGCATLDERMKGYVGQPRSEVVKNWGPPDEETKLKNGGSRIVYREDVPLIHPSQYVDPALRICEKVFVTDSRGIITSYSHDNCE
jgi:hypothetical protein